MTCAAAWLNRAATSARPQARPDDRSDAPDRRKLEDERPGAPRWTRPGPSPRAWRRAPAPRGDLPAGDPDRPDGRGAGRDRRCWSAARTAAPRTSGAFTGDVSAEMLADAGARAGDPRPLRAPRRLWRDRRPGGAPRSRRALRAGLEPIVCVGETLEQRKAGAGAGGGDRAGEGLAARRAGRQGLLGGLRAGLGDRHRA